MTALHKQAKVLRMLAHNLFEHLYSPRMVGEITEGKK